MYQRQTYVAAGTIRNIHRLDFNWGIIGQVHTMLEEFLTKNTSDTEGIWMVNVIELKVY